MGQMRIRAARRPSSPSIISSFHHSINQSIQLFPISSLAHSPSPSHPPSYFTYLLSSNSSSHPPIYPSPPPTHDGEENQPLPPSPNSFSVFVHGSALPPFFLVLPLFPPKVPVIQAPQLSSAALFLSGSATSESAPTPSWRYMAK